MSELQVNPDFKSIIPPLSKEEFDTLEQNILSEGKVRDPIVLWNGVIVDGHNRYELAIKHSIPYTTDDMDFEDEDAAKLWIIDNQLGRRNIPPIVRIELAQRKEPLIQKRAKENSLANLKQNTDVVETAHSGRTRDQVAQIAGVSPDTYKKAKSVMKQASPEAIQDLREGKKKIGEVYREMRTGSKICGACGEEKPLSRFAESGSKKCLDCKAKKILPTTDTSKNIPAVDAAENPLTQESNEPISRDDDDDTDYEENAANEESICFDDAEEICEAAPQNPYKNNVAEIALGTASQRTTLDSKEYREDLRQIRENVKKAAEHAKTHKRTIDEFKQLFRANSERLVIVLEHNINFMDAEIWADENNKKIALDLIDEAVGAINNLRRNF